MKDASPLRLTDLYILYPCRFIIGSLLTFAIFGGIALALGYFELSPITRRDFLIWSDEKVYAWDKMVAAEEYFMIQTDTDEDTKPLQMK